MQESLEIFKLEPSDRRTFFLIVDNASLDAITLWIEFVAAEYRSRGAGRIDTTKFIIEAYQPCSGVRSRKIY